jgi:hypothetical protein
MTRLRNGVGVSISNIPTLSSKRRATAFSPLSLFADGSQGVWYDDSLTSSMFQDSAGTTAAALESPVGLQLDLSKNLALGTELFSSFTSTGNWTVSGSTYSIVSAVSSTDLNVTFSGTTGKRYLITFTASGVSGTVIYYPLNTNPPAVVNGTNTIRQISDVGFFIIRASTGASATISNISIKEILGNHRTQTTSANRPTLSARYNLLTKTENLANAAWSNINAGTGVAPVATANAGTAPDGTNTATRLVFNRGASNTSSDYSLCTQAITSVVGVNYTGSVKIKSNTGATQNVLVYTASSSVGGISVVAVGTSWVTITNPSITPPVTSTSILIGTRGSGSFGGDQNLDILVWGADLRPTDQTVTLPTYQRVDTSSVYDTVGFPQYLKYNGSNSSLSTASINFTATAQMSVFSGVRKLVDATYPTIFEFSANSDSNNGAFLLTASQTVSLPYYFYQSRGTASVSRFSSSYVAPITNVVTGLSNITAPSVTLRVNGSDIQTSTGTQGTGNYGNYPLYFGARAGLGLFLNGQEYQTIIVGKTLTATEISNTETYVNSKTKAY